MDYISRKQSGFTLVELMIAIVLGLLVTAAAMQLFVGGSISYRLQENAAEVQDGGVFGLNYATQQIQLANYGNSDHLGLTPTTPQGGIVFTSGLREATDVNITSLVDDQKIDSKYLSHAAGATGWGGLSNTTTQSDQLTIQFIAPVEMMNCEGERVFKGDLVVQRYFLRSHQSATTDDENVASLGLACDANTPNTLANVSSNPEALSRFGTDTSLGEVIIPRVDQFKVQVLAKTGNNYRYYNLNDYKTAAESATEVPEIQLIRISVLIRSNVRTENVANNPNKTFVMLGEDVTLKTASEGNSNRYSRAVYETSISLRNALKES